MVAAVVLTVGLLAVSASVLSIQRLAQAGALHARAVDVAASRLDRLAAAGCGAGSGATSSGAFAETWTVVAAGALRRARVGVTFAPDAGPPHHVVVSLDFVCGAGLP